MESKGGGGRGAWEGVGEENRRVCSQSSFVYPHEEGFWWNPTGIFANFSACFFFWVGRWVGEEEVVLYMIFFSFFLHPFPVGISSSSPPN